MKVKSLALVCGLLAAAAALAQPSEFRDWRLARIDDPVRVQFSETARPEPDRFRDTATVAAQALGWKVLDGGDGRLDLTRTVADKHTMHIELVYNASGYLLRYLDSTNLLYQESAPTKNGGKMRGIHKNYNVWVRELSTGINTAIGLGTVAAVSPPVPRPGLASARNDPSSALQRTPLPEDINIVTPGPDAPAVAAALSGIWVGRWDGKFDHTLVVERIEGNSVRFVYALNPATMSDSSGGNWSRRRGTLDADGVLHASWKTQRGTMEISYRLSPDGTHLLGERVREDRIATATLERVVPTEAAR